MALIETSLPQGSGVREVQAIRRLENALEHVVILALTADVMPETKALCKSTGMDGFVTKPVSMDAIQEEYARCLRMIPESALSFWSARAAASDE